MSHFFDACWDAIDARLHARVEGGVMSHERVEELLRLWCLDDWELVERVLTDDGAGGSADLANDSTEKGAAELRQRLGAEVRNRAAAIFTRYAEALLFAAAHSRELHREEKREQASVLAAFAARLVPEAPRPLLIGGRAAMALGVYGVAERLLNKCLGGAGVAQSGGGEDGVDDGGGGAAAGTSDSVARLGRLTRRAALEELENAKKARGDAIESLLVKPTNKSGQDRVKAAEKARRLEVGSAGSSVGGGGAAGGRRRPSRQAAEPDDAEQGLYYSPSLGITISAASPVVVLANTTDQRHFSRVDLTNYPRLRLYVAFWPL